MEYSFIIFVFSLRNCRYYILKMLVFAVAMLDLIGMLCNEVVWRSGLILVLMSMVTTRLTHLDQLKWMEWCSYDADDWIIRVIYGQNTNAIVVFFGETYLHTSPNIVEVPTELGFFFSSWIISLILSIGIWAPLEFE